MKDGGRAARGTPIDRPGGLGRREVLGAAAALIAAGLLPAGCTRGAAALLESGQVSVPLGDLAGGRRVTITVRNNPVEVFRDASGVTARLLRCTHSGCVVKWKPESRTYSCPCHDGHFDEDGKVLAGPPPGPLRGVPVRVQPDRIIVG